MGRGSSQKGSSTFNDDPHDTAPDYLKEPSSHVGLQRASCKIFTSFTYRSIAFDI